MKNKIAYLLIGSSIFSSVFLFSSRKADAFLGFGDIVYDPINWAVHGLQLSAAYLTDFSLGIPGSGAAVRAALKLGKAPCDKFRAAGDFAKIIDDGQKFTGTDALVPSSAQLTLLNTEMINLTSIRICYEAIKNAQDVGGSVASVAGGEQVLGELESQDQTIEQAINAVNARLDDLSKVRNQGYKDMWKGVATRILMNVQQKITTNLVNKMVAKYKITDYTKYADAVATQIYATNYISDHFTDGNDQLILKSMMQNDLTKNQIYPLLQMQVKKEIGFDPLTYDVSSPDFFQRMTQSSANPYLKQAIYQDRLDSIKGIADTSAQKEIASGNGFIPVRNIDQAVIQQQSELDKKRQQLSKDLQLKQVALLDLQNKRDINPSAVDINEINKGIQEVEKIQSDVNDLAAQNPSFKPLSDGIKNPGGMVASSLNSYLQSQLNNANSQKTENLPFFANFIDNVATNFLSNIIEQGVSNLSLIGEGNKVSAGNIAPSSIIPNDAQASNLKAVDNISATQSIVFEGSKNTSVAGQYSLYWDVTALGNAASVTITGPSGFKTQTASLKNSIKITAPPHAVMILTVYDNSVPSKIITSASYTIPLDPNPVLNLPSTSSTGCTSSSSNQFSAIKCIEDQLKNDGTLTPPTIQYGTSTSAIIISLAHTIGLPQVAGAQAVKPREPIRGNLPGSNLPIRGQ